MLTFCADSAMLPHQQPDSAFDAKDACEHSLECGRPVASWSLWGEQPDKCPGILTSHFECRCAGAWPTFSRHAVMVDASTMGPVGKNFSACAIDWVEGLYKSCKLEMASFYTRKPASLSPLIGGVSDLYSMRGDVAAEWISARTLQQQGSCTRGRFRPPPPRCLVM